MSLSAALFGRDSFIHKAINILGLGIPGWLDKQFGAKEAEPQIRTLGELSQQTAKEAEPRPIVWGRVRPIGGNIIHCQAPVTRMITTKVDGGGKGGSKKKQKQTTQHVYRTYAIGVCEGPITGYTRIWRNNKLVYDARGGEWGQENNPVFLKQFRLYLGKWDQIPDPTLEAIWGVGNVPAYRGTAYIVSIDEDLTDLAGSVPQFIFEVERAEGVSVTSQPYAVEETETYSVNSYTLIDGNIRYPDRPVFVEIDVGTETYSVNSHTLVDGSLKPPLINWTETYSVNSHTLVDGSLKPPLINWAETYSVNSYTLIDGSLKPPLINWAETYSVNSYTLVDGSLA